MHLGYRYVICVFIYSKKFGLKSSFNEDLERGKEAAVLNNEMSKLNKMLIKTRANILPTKKTDNKVQCLSIKKF